MNTKTYATFLLIGTVLCLPPQLSAQTVTPNDPMFSQQWNLQRIGARNAWATTTGASNVVVAVIDAGVNYLHQDLAANMWRNPGETGFDTNGVDKATNGIDDDGNGYADDVYGIDTGNGDSDPMDEGGNPFHGTACASIIGAVGNNAKGIAGLNWQVSLMAIRSYSEAAASDFIPTYVEAINYVLMMKNRGVNIRVISHGGAYGSWDSQAFREARERVEAAGILWVGGAANHGRDLDQWPFYSMSWRTRNTIVVGGTDTGDNLWSSSNYGRNTVDLAAPAVSIPAASGPANNAYTGSFGGNSASGPHVAGAAALLFAANPALTPDDVKAALFGSVDQPIGLRGKMATHGRLNIARALEYLTNTNPAAIVVTALPRGQKTPANAPLEVIFNRPMNPATVESAFVITPPITGTFEWAADNRSFVYRHDTPFDVTTNYSVRLLGSAQDASGGTLDGDYDRIREGSPTDDFTWTFNFALPNDDFAGAQVLTGVSGFVQANNQRASIVDEEVVPFELFPDWAFCGSTLWYRWTPPEADGWFTFDLTSGTVFDSLLGIYTGNQLEQAVSVARNDNYGASTRSRISFSAAAGTNYFVVVASKYDGDPTQVGNFKLAWYPTPAPSFTGTQFSPASGAPGTVVTLFGTNFAGATSVLFNGASASFTNALTNNLDLRITAVVPSDALSGPITVVTPHGNVTSTSSFQVPPPKLALSLSGPNLLIRWPGTSTAWLLEETADPASGQWTPVTQAPIITNGETRTLLEPPPAGNGFYRLRRN